jgi:hypothetical protein
MGVFPFLCLQGQDIAGFRIHLHATPVVNRKGWTSFRLFLKDGCGMLSARKCARGTWAPSPVLEGIHSRGGRGVKGWVEIGDYSPTVTFAPDHGAPHLVDLEAVGLDARLFQCLSELVPPGGHMMLAYETAHDSPFHRETRASLERGIPPACTPLGERLVAAGFTWVKDFYVAEGGHEGPRKLWGEKPFSAQEAATFADRTLSQLRLFSCEAGSPGEDPVLSAALARATRVIDFLSSTPL